MAKGPEVPRPERLVATEELEVPVLAYLEVEVLMEVWQVAQPLLALQLHLEL